MVRHLRVHLAVNGPTTAQKIIRPVSSVAALARLQPRSRPVPSRGLCLVNGQRRARGSPPIRPLSIAGAALACLRRER